MLKLVRDISGRAFSFLACRAPMLFLTGIVLVI